MSGNEGSVQPRIHLKDDIGIQRKEQIVECLMGGVVHRYLDLTVEGLVRENVLKFLSFQKL